MSFSPPLSRAASTEDLAENSFELSQDLVFHTSNQNAVVCALCTNVLDNPHQCSQCSSAWCKRCILDWLETHSSCPSTKHAVSKFEDCFVPASFSLTETLENTSVRCPLRSKGCDFICTIGKDRSTIKEHYYEKCPYAKIACTECKAGLLRKDLSTHGQSCPEKLIVCDLCATRMPRKFMKEHLIITSEQKGLKCHGFCFCPNGCKDSSQRPVILSLNDVASHLSSCPLQKIECTVCAAELIRKDLMKHMKEQVTEHILTTNLRLLEEMKDLKRELKQVRSELSDLKARYNKSLPKLEVSNASNALSSPPPSSSPSSSSSSSSSTPSTRIPISPHPWICVSCGLVNSNFDSKCLNCAYPYS
eukprot:TRINITY_DN6390_c0_g1_i1.p1 TRINITY_DN6390_c0_g1~~TRINITY_DN6390_c0_g1_i1.p1  ORF type:complete len:361 (-),score=48.91 TRINITY_DN6390_c0_g1_i1:262-1344(-)